jgi:hypothetical protein
MLENRDAKSLENAPHIDYEDKAGNKVLHEYLPSESLYHNIGVSID